MFGGHFHILALLLGYRFLFVDQVCFKIKIISCFVLIFRGQFNFEVFVPIFFIFAEGFNGAAFFL